MSLLVLFFEVSVRLTTPYNLTNHTISTNYIIQQFKSAANLISQSSGMATGISTQNHTFLQGCFVYGDLRHKI
jgi:hypothetical protein